jgi:putative ABC transport system ATP-binding protein
MDIFFDFIEKNAAAMILVTHDEQLASRCKRVYRLQNKELLMVK